MESPVGTPKVSVPNDNTLGLVPVLVSMALPLFLNAVTVNCIDKLGNPAVPKKSV